MRVVFEGVRIKPLMCEARMTMLEEIMNMNDKIVHNFGLTFGLFYINNHIINNTCDKNLRMKKTTCLINR